MPKMKFHQCGRLSRSMRPTRRVESSRMDRRAQQRAQAMPKISLSEILSIKIFVCSFVCIYVNSNLYLAAIYIVFSMKYK